ncbi:MAG: CvpA family protein [Clostridia bacterium]|nr:CvpA family protein [Clostridia bacterium]
MVFDIAALSFVLIFSFIMMKRGGMRALMSLGGFVLSIVVASMLYPYLTEWVYETPLPENLEEIVREHIKVDNKEEEAEMESIDALPDFVREAFLETAETAVESFSDTFAKTITRLIINIIVFVLLIVVTKLIISLLSGAVNFVTKLPLIHEIDSLVGFGCGLAISLIVVWLAVLLLGVLSSSNEVVAEWIEGSRAVGIMSNITPFE